MSDEYELIPLDPIRKLEAEVEELKEYLKSLKSELKKEDTIISEKENVSVPVDKELYKELANALIRSNIELQSKIAELIVSTNELNKEIKRLVDIFKEAAMSYMESIKKETKKKELKEADVLMKKLEEIENVNVKIVENLEKMNRLLEEFKHSERSNKEQKKIIPPPLPPRALPPKI